MTTSVPTIGGRRRRSFAVAELLLIRELGRETVFRDRSARRSGSLATLANRAKPAVLSLGIPLGISSTGTALTGASSPDAALRLFAFVAPARKVTEDVDFHGCPLKKGDMVLVPLSAATRDPSAFDDPTTFIPERAVQNHIAFGAGPHRCLGSHLARRELRVALQEWHARIPDYRLPEGVDVVEHGGMYGIDSLELSWDV